MTTNILSKARPITKAGTLNERQRQVYAERRLKTLCWIGNDPVVKELDESSKFPFGVLRSNGILTIISEAEAISLMSKAILEDEK